MKKQCLVCDEKLGFRKFKSIDGYLCKKCYQKASRNYSQTVTKLTKTDILIILNEEDTSPLNHFTITKDINKIVLFDDENSQICFPNNPKYSDVNNNPEIFNYSQIKKCSIDKESFMKDKEMVGTLILNVQIGTYDKRVLILPKPISIKSSVYRTMDSLAENLNKEIMSRVS